MKELKKYYEKKLAEYEQLHKELVKSNENMNALYEAKNQAHNVGDIKIDFAVAVLEKASKEEKTRNEKLRNDVNYLCKILRDMERYIKEITGEELDGVTKIQGY